MKTSIPEPLPSIEIFIAAIAKDYWLLPRSIRLAVLNSKNPINKITVITQDRSIQECLRVTTMIDVLPPIEVLSEDNQLGQEFRLSLKRVFGDRYGWALQQFLTVNFVLKSRSAGVLALNADTLIINEKSWLTTEVQALMVSSEYHPPYYELLNQLGLPCRNPRYTFVTHHMLFVPGKFQAILNKLGISNLDDLLNKVIQSLSLTTDNAICIEFELYAQGLMLWFPETVRLQRFGNLGISSKLFNSNLGSEKLLDLKQFSGYNSLSIHSWS